MERSGIQEHDSLSQPADYLISTSKRRINAIKLRLFTSPFEKGGLRGIFKFQPPLR